MFLFFHRYRLQVRVEDDTRSANFVLFDKEATVLIGKSCTEMVDAYEKVFIMFN